MGKVRIELGDRSYDIHVGRGLLDQASELISNVCRGKVAAIVTNRRIGTLYAERLCASLAKAGIASHVIPIPAGERYKMLSTVHRVYERLLDHRIDRTGIVIGLGGGVVGDLAGFAAATYVRGVDFVQVPTSLLAQVDASVGGKTGANLSRGKNLVGAFYQPKIVLIDVSVLRTLPRREFRAGLAEVIKHGIIRDARYFAYMESNLAAIKRLDPGILERVIERSCEIKADVVARDEREAGLRRILNFGHTVGHAVESVTAYRTLLHGEAVAIGMVTAALLATELGSAGLGLVDRMVGLLEAAGLPYKLPAGVEHSDIVTAMGLDKKVAHGRLHCVLVNRIGEAFVVESPGPEMWVKALEAQAEL